MGLLDISEEKYTLVNTDPANWNIYTIGLGTYISQGWHTLYDSKRNGPRWEFKGEHYFDLANLASLRSTYKARRLTWLTTSP